MPEYTLLMGRHAPTRLNEGGAEKERSRGWGSFPPDPDVLPEVISSMAEGIRKSGIPVHRIASSDLPRAAITAKELGKELDVPVHPTRQLRTWNTGDMTGKTEAEVAPLKKKYIKNPEEKPAGGESFGNFEQRWGSALRSMMKHNEENPDDQVAAIIHGNMDWTAPHVANGEDVDADNYDKMRPPGALSVLKWSDTSAPRIEEVKSRASQIQAETA